MRRLAEAEQLDRELWRELVELGWPGIAVPEDHGGQGLGLGELAILCEELGRAVAPVPFLGSALVAAFIDRAGSAAQRERWLERLATGACIGAVGESRDGRAAVVPGAADADVIVLVERGRAMLIASDDASIAPCASIDPTRPAAAVSCAPDAGEPLGGDVEGALDRAVVTIAAELVGVCDRALELTVAYVKERRQFGSPIGSFQAVAHRCAEMLLATESARATTGAAAWAADADEERLPESAAMAKASAAVAGRDVTAAAIQAHGGIGFTWESDLHWLYRRAQSDAVLLGGPSWHRRRLAGVLAGERNARVTATAGQS